MPTSDSLNIPPIIKAVTSFHPKSILDIGCGFGKYGVLFREYIDITDKHYFKPEWQTRIVGVEVFEKFRNPIWEFVYDDVKIGEAQTLIPQLGRFDVTLIADVIEHFDKPVADQVVRSALANSKAVIISTPHAYSEQEDEFGNEYMRHRCEWGAADAPPGSHCHTIGLLGTDVFVVTNEPLAKLQIYPTDWTELLYLRSLRKFRKLGPLAKPVALGVWAVNRVFT
jgi:SAM-dependent methyltransferase